MLRNTSTLTTNRKLTYASCGRRQYFKASSLASGHGLSTAYAPIFPDIGQHFSSYFSLAGPLSVDGIIDNICYGHQVVPCVFFSISHLVTGHCPNYSLECRRWGVWILTLAPLSPSASLSARLKLAWANFLCVS